jgi:hypothetical protein
VGCVRRGGNERGELMDADAATHILELASLFELVDERDRVDGLAARVQPERGAVHLRVALAVEVARVEDLADRPDRAGGEHHRPEDRLLGLEVLRRDRGGRRLRDGGELRHVAAQLTALLEPAEKDGMCRRIEHTFAPLCTGRPAPSTALP